MPKKKEVNFKYVVARPWDLDDPEAGLCIYSYGSDIQEGTMKEAEKFLEYVKRQSKYDTDTKKEIDSYGIYVVGLTKIG
jgi:hypothetical protein